ncbi:MAG TPA: XdhC family protein [Steroidobacteraceae bacterium]|nr:XdhC family protein [Steroidobacteraceae bacterium]
MSDARTDLFAAAQRLQQRGEPYALVSVVRTQAPTSARAGDKALVTSQGIVYGWIGGGCAQPAVLHTVRQALHDGRARLIRIAPETEAPPDPDSSAEDANEFGISCHSGGTIELFIDPILPPTRLVVIGDSPVAVALAGLAPRVGLPVTVIASGADAQRFADACQVIDTDDAAAVSGQVPAGSLVVVATQGRRDLQGLRAALALKALHIWLVASARKAQALRESLLAANCDPLAVNAIIAPAGHPIGAQTPEEIALSVLAAVVSVRRAQRGTTEDGTTQALPAGTQTTAKCAH